MTNQEYYNIWGYLQFTDTMALLIVNEEIIEGELYEGELYKISPTIESIQRYPNKVKAEIIEKVRKIKLYELGYKT